ncbi:chitinase-3-like protein 1 [Magallana gigas]|uniref:chitinase-3-like protein 1 n=1 Tax=Magallana gigas TaxID=29159 RepID=UPI0033413798
MMVNWTSISFLILLFFSSGYGMLVCYFTNWSQYRPGNGRFTPQNIDPHLCTHIAYAFGKLGSNNRVATVEQNDVTLYSQVNALKSTNPNLKTLLAMGGWSATSGPYSNMASSASTRSVFINSLIAWLRQYNFDGVDMDWEFPAYALRGGIPADYTNFALLIKEMRQAFNAEAQSSGRSRLIISAAVSHAKTVIDAGYNVPQIAMYIDFIFIMAYDMHGPWEGKTGLHSGLYASNNDPDKKLNTAWAANYWNSKGMPKSKIVVGIPTYGKSFILDNAVNNGVGAPTTGRGPAGRFTGEAGALSYYEICEMQRSGSGTTRRDLAAKVPYFVNTNTKLWVGFEDKQSVRDKIRELVVGQGYAGAMTWALDLDDFGGSFCAQGSYPLISTMKVELGSGGGSSSSTSSTTTPTTITTTSGGAVSCVGNEGALLPHPDCTKYYQCVNGIPMEKSCPGGLHFSVTISACDWPSNAGCQ